jgi:hypothetical protein
MKTRASGGMPPHTTGRRGGKGTRLGESKEDFGPFKVNGKLTKY